MSQPRVPNSAVERWLRAGLGQLWSDLRMVTVGLDAPQQTWVAREDLRFAPIGERGPSSAAKSSPAGAQSQDRLPSPSRTQTQPATPKAEPRDLSSRFPPGSPVSPRPCMVVGVDYPAQDAVSIWIRPRDGGSFNVRAGQFFTVCVAVDGVTYRRAYSVANDVGTMEPRSGLAQCGAVRLCIRRVEGGIVSNHLVDSIGVGDMVEVLGPSGHFAASLLEDCRAQPEMLRHVVCIAGGSGITPMLSIVPGLLHASQATRVTLIAGHRSDAHTLYRAEFERLAVEHPHRLSLVFAAERGASRDGDVHGRLDRKNLSRIFKTALKGSSETKTRFLLCGPEGLRSAAHEVLATRAVPQELLEEERFDQPHLRSDQSFGSTTAHLVKLAVAGCSHEVMVAPGQTILDAGLAAGVGLAYSCTMGGCGACALRCRSGTVTMAEPNCLSVKERREGMVLACIASPQGACELEALS